MCNLDFNYILGIGGAVIVLVVMGILTISVTMLLAHTIYQIVKNNL